MPRQKKGEESTRTQVREWIRQLPEGRKEVNLVELTSGAMEHFMNDENFVQQFMSESLRPMIYELAQESLAYGRSLYIQQVTKSIQEGKQPRSGIFAKWFEHAGSKHVNLMEMTRRDLFLAAQERQDRGEHELGLARLWRNMASKLTSPTMKVKTKFKEAEIQEMIEGLKPVDVSIAAD